ncbi:MAG: stage III sporulation protein AF [Eubacteriales bacterium]|nr:stage III sporulation protein AF [Eubacteriales bacterium]
MFGWMKSMILYLILSGVVINFAPNENYKRYIRFFSGLMVIMLLANPIQYIFRLGSGNINSFVAEMERDMEHISGNHFYDNMYNYYEMGISEGIRITLMEANINVERVEVLTDKSGGCVKTTVFLTNSEKSDDITIKKLISKVYNLEDARIYIVRR